METTTYDLGGIISSPTDRIKFCRLEMAKSEYLPLAVVWYTTPGNPAAQRGARIDLQKQIFLDDFAQFDRSSFSHEARQIVAFVHSLAVQAKQERKEQLKAQGA